MNRKWKKLWADALATVLISLFCGMIGLGIVYLVCTLVALIYYVIIGG
jgi:hypothetical protein